MQRSVTDMLRRPATISRIIGMALLVLLPPGHIAEPNAVLVESASPMHVVLMSTEESLTSCRNSVAHHRAQLEQCAIRSNPVTCACFCPTCAPEEWPYRRKPPTCTTPPPPPPTTPFPDPPPPPTPPPPPPLDPLPILSPVTLDYLPTLGPIGTVLPTTTTTTTPPPPPKPAPAPAPKSDGSGAGGAGGAGGDGSGAPAPTTTPDPNGKCVNDGHYRGPGGFSYIRVGEGICLGQDGMKMPFMKRRELVEMNLECMCREACDKHDGCVGYSVQYEDKGYGLSCQAYFKKGSQVPADLSDDGWVDLGSFSSERYLGEKIRGSDGANGRECFFKKPIRGDPAPASAASASLLSLHRLQKTSVADDLSWQRKQLALCRKAEEEHLSLLEQRGCRSRGLLGRARQVPLMPAECTCDCPICNYWQLPPPMCLMPKAPPPPPPPPPPPAGLPPTPIPQKPTPPAVPPQKPLPPLPPWGEEFLPTLAPLPGI
eukprot:gnl/TRDRNA2_/TRDRNA2_170510_c4_seq1.p1 gnl/TRDRNA2_/TRDRNA2_170510_c4~~gnl/TRDRNA2_/TRDRNA2_170510_c4_seq1.p1  ORF type:complete len:485 (+),score=62.91 gnl/TRDRNA2_/TRDRNA2_170510_c4_seq1:193-1647(+)